MYAIEPRQLYFSLKIHLYELNDEFNWASLLNADVNDASSAEQTTNTSQIQFRTYQIKVPSIELNAQKYLLVRQPSSQANKERTLDADDQSNVRLLRHLPTRTSLSVGPQWWIYGAQ